MQFVISLFLLGTLLQKVFGMGDGTDGTPPGTTGDGSTQPPTSGTPPACMASSLNTVDCVCGSGTYATCGPSYDGAYCCAGVCESSGCTGGSATARATLGKEGENCVVGGLTNDQRCEAQLACQLSPATGKYQCLQTSSLLVANGGNCSASSKCISRYCINPVNNVRCTENNTCSTGRCMCARNSTALDPLTTECTSLNAAAAGIPNAATISAASDAVCVGSAEQGKQCMTTASGKYYCQFGFRGKCNLRDQCVNSEDCANGALCLVDPSNNTMKICLPACDLLNTEGQCQNVGDICGRNEACAGSMYCQGIVADHAAPAMQSYLGVGANAIFVAGKCALPDCTVDGDVCKVDSECCYGSCDVKNTKTCRSATKFNDALSTFQTVDADKIFMPCVQEAEGGQQAPGTTTVSLSELSSPVIDTFTGRLYDKKQLCLEAVDPDSLGKCYTKFQINKMCTCGTAYCPVGSYCCGTTGATGICQNTPCSPLIPNERCEVAVMVSQELKPDGQIGVGEIKPHKIDSFVKDGLKLKSTFKNPVQTRTQANNATIAVLKPGVVNAFKIEVKESTVGKFFKAEKCKAEGVGCMTSGECCGNSLGQSVCDDRFTVALKSGTAAKNSDKLVFKSPLAVAIPSDTNIRISGAIVTIPLKTGADAVVSEKLYFPSGTPHPKIPTGMVTVSAMKGGSCSAKGTFYVQSGANADAAEVLVSDKCRVANADAADADGKNVKCSAYASTSDCSGDCTHSTSSLLTAAKAGDKCQLTWTAPCSLLFANGLKEIAAKPGAAVDAVELDLTGEGQFDGGSAAGNDDRCELSYISMNQKRCIATKDAHGSCMDDAHCKRGHECALEFGDNHYQTGKSFYPEWGASSSPNNPFQNLVQSQCVPILPLKSTCNLPNPGSPHAFDKNFCSGHWNDQYCSYSGTGYGCVACIPSYSESPCFNNEECCSGTCEFGGDTTGMNTGGGVCSFSKSAFEDGSVAGCYSSVSSYVGNVSLSNFNNYKTCDAIPGVLTELTGTATVPLVTFGDDCDASGASRAPQSPHKPRTTILCISHAVGAVEQVPTPACEMLYPQYSSVENAAPTCRIGKQVSTDAQLFSNTAVYGFAYEIPTVEGKLGDNVTLKIVACGAQAAWHSTFGGFPSDTSMSSSSTSTPQSNTGTDCSTFTPVQGDTCGNQLSEGQCNTFTACNGYQTCTWADSNGCSEDTTAGHSTGTTQSDSFSSTSSSTSSQQQGSARRAQSPVLVISYTFEEVRDSCIDSSPLKCTSQACAKGGNASNALDMVEYLPAAECYTTELVRQQDNPIYPSCSKNVDCPTKSCLMDYGNQVTLPYNLSIVNVTLYDIVGVDVNCTSDNNCVSGSYPCSNMLKSSECPGGGACRETAEFSSQLVENMAKNKTGKCALPPKKKITVPILKCETESAQKKRYEATPSARVFDEMKRLFSPVCAQPRLLTLVVESEAVANDIWPRFDGSFRGPYYVSLANFSHFSLYGRFNYDGATASYEINGASIHRFAMGESSISHAMSSEQVNLTITVTSAPFATIATPGSMEYIFYIARWGEISVDPIAFKNKTDTVSGLRVGNTATYRVNGLDVGEALYFRKMLSGHVVKVFHTSMSALNTAHAVPESDSTVWVEVTSQSRGLVVGSDKKFVSVGCSGNVVLVQVDGRILFAYSVGRLSDAGSRLPVQTSSTGVATIKLTKTTVGGFCSPGSALETAFTSKITGTNRLRLELHEDAGPFLLSSALVMESASPILSQVQNVQYAQGEVTLAFPGPHGLSFSDYASLELPGQNQLIGKEVRVLVLDLNTIRLKYEDAQDTASLEGRYIDGFSATGRDAPFFRQLCYTQAFQVGLDGVVTAGSLPLDTSAIPAINGGTAFRQIAQDGTIVGSGVLMEDSEPGRLCLSITPTSSAGSNASIVNGIKAYSRKITGFLCPALPNGVRPQRCNVLCHIGDEKFSDFSSSSSLHTMSNQFDGTAVVSPSVGMIGRDLEVSIHPHDCSQTGAKVYSELGEAICDPSKGLQCSWADENMIVVGPIGTTSTYYKLDGAVSAPLMAAKVKKAITGNSAYFDKIDIIGIPRGNSKPVISSTVGNGKTTPVQIPDVLPSASTEGFLTNDIDTNFMGSFNTRFLKIFNENSRVRLVNISFVNGGICDDVQFNFKYVSFSNEAARSTSTLTASVQPILSNAASSASAYSTESKFCSVQKPFAELDTTGIGKRNGGAVYFSGSDLDVVDCEFLNNRVTGNGGAIFVETPQPGRAVQDPDLDIVSDSLSYPTRIPHENSDIMSTTFKCTGCIFRNNLALSIARGADPSFESTQFSFVGGLGGAVAAGLGGRFMRKLDVNSIDMISSFTPAFGYHGKLSVTMKQCTFDGNLAWYSGGAIAALGGKTVAKQSSMKLSIDGAHFDDNRAVKGEGGAILFEKGHTNGDYECAQKGCDMNYIGMTVANSLFVHNVAGEAKENNDIVGNTQIESSTASWRHVSNFGKSCGAACCDKASNNVCALIPPATAKCDSSLDEWGASYMCNDGVFLRGTKTTNMCSINAKSVTECEAGYHYGLMAGRCLPCETGRYRPTKTLNTDYGSEHCLICPAGKYSTGTSVDGSLVAKYCKVCETGKYQDAPEKPDCKSCAAVISNSFSIKTGGISSDSCDCTAGFFDMRQNASDNRVLETFGIDTERCDQCPEGADCLTEGMKLHSLPALPGYFRPADISKSFYLCSDVQFPGAVISSSAQCVGGNMSVQCAPGRNASVPLCDQCMDGYIVDAATNKCVSCAIATGSLDLKALMYGLMILGVMFGYIGSLFFLTRAATMFDMLDNDSSGFIEMEELTKAIRTYEGINEETISDQRLKEIYMFFCAPGTPGIPASLFKDMWLHVLMEAKDPKEQMHIQRRAYRAVKRINHHEPNKSYKKKRNAHIRALTDESFIAKMNTMGAGSRGTGGGDVGMNAELEVDEDAEYVGAGSSEASSPSAGGRHSCACPNIGSTVKIIFSWGQILSSFNLTFRIPWPTTFDQLMSVLYAPFNVDVFALFGSFKCQVNTNYSAQFYAHMMVPIVILGVICGAYVTARLIKILPFCGTHMFDKNTLRARVMKLINLVIFVMYPGLGLRIFRVFATSKYGEYSYLSADLTVRTDTKEYTDMRSVAWVWMVIYVVCIPASYAVILGCQRHFIKMDPDSEDGQCPEEFHSQVVACRVSYGAIYKDYKRRMYFFELFEMSRKITLVGVLVLLGENGGTQIFIGVLICFFYVLLCALTKPLVSPTDQFLQYITSVQLFVTLITGLLLRNRAFEKAQGMGSDEDDTMIDVVLVFMTLTVFGTIALVVGTVLRDTICPNVSCRCPKLPSKRLKSSKEDGGPVNLSKVVPVN